MADDGWKFQPPTPTDVLKWAFVVFAIGVMGLVWVAAVIALWWAS